MSTTIDSLDIQITTSAGQSAANIEKLANALEKLRANSKLTSVTNNLGKLKNALDGLQSTSGAISQLGRLSQAMQGLSNLPKLTNLTSAMNALKNIPNVLNGLDANKLDEFKKKMEKLADALSPLATKITAVSKGFSKLPSQVSSAVTATNRMATASQNAKKGFDMSSIGLMALIANYSTLISTVNQAIQAVSNMLSQAIEWDGIQFRFGRAFGEDAEETYAYIEKINDALGINIQQFMQYSSLYGSLLSGFGMAQDKITTISVGLTELSYDIWAAYNDRFKTLEDASEAVRSAITGEIEPIRNAGIALTEASLQEFIDQTHLAGVSIEKLTEAQKSEIRYAAMVNAAMSQGIVGTYAREMQTAEGAVRSLSQSFKGLVQALGSLFIPLLQLVVPYVTVFVELITEAVFWVAKLFGIPIQKIDWGTSTKGVGGIAEGAKEATKGLDSASKAAKKLKDYTMGFDELNVIKPDTDSGAGAGAGVGAGAGGSGFGSGLDLKSLWDDSIFAEASKKVDEIKAKIKDFLKEWGWLIGLVGAALTGLMIHKAWPTIMEWAGKISNAFRTVIRVFSEIKMALKGVQFAPMYGGLNKVVTALKTATTAVATFVGGLSVGAIVGIVAVITAIASVVYFLYKNWEEVTEAVKNFFKENIAPKLEKIRGHFSDMIDAMGPIGDMFVKIYQKAKEFISGIDWSKLDWIGKIFETVGGIIFSVVGGVIATAFNVLVGMIENVIQVFTGLTQIVSGVVQFLVALFTGDFSSILDIVLLVTTGVQNLFDGMVGFVVGIITDFVGGLISWFKKLGEELFGKIVPEMIDGIVDWFLSLPDKILGPIGDFAEKVLTTFKNLWTDTRAWWNTNVQPKFTRDYWRTKFDVIRVAIKDKLAEVKNAAAEKWSEIKSWFDQNIAPKFTKDYWKTKFDTIRAAIHDKLTEVKSKVVEKWGEIKSWFDSNIAPKLTKNYWIDKFSGFKDGFETVIKNAMNAGIDKINNFISRVNNALRWDWDAFNFMGQEIFPSGSFTLATIPTISRFENGGFIEDGLFTMNRGEIAGKFNNGKSVVANNEQIIAGISEGVYSAVVAAMSETQSSGEQPVVVYLDGKQIYSSVKRTESRRGVNLMGNQVGYVY